MTATLDRPRSTPRDVKVHAEGNAVKLASHAVVPEHLLDGGEIVILAIKPSMWFVPLVSARWILAGIGLMALGMSEWSPPEFQWYFLRAGAWAAVLRIGWAILEWVSTLYVLTNHRLMRIRGVFHVELFECRLKKIQNMYLSLTLAERLTRTGTLVFMTAAAAGGGSAMWRIVARPLEVHEQVVAAIRKAQDRNGGAL